MTQLKVRSPMPLYVYVFNSERSFAPYRDAIAGVNPHIAGIFIHGSSANYALIRGETGEIDRVVYHELTHSYLANTVVGLPPWINEGLAEFYSTYTRVADSILIGVPAKDHLSVLYGSGLMPLSELFAFRPQGRGAGDLRVEQFYAESWLFAHYLLIGNPTRGAQLGDFLSRLDQGQSPDAAFPAAFHASIAEVQRELGGYLHAPRHKYLQFSRKDLGTVAAADPNTLPHPELLTALGDLLIRSEAPADAQAFFEAALKLAPDNARALALLGLQTDNAAMLDRAVAIDTPDFRPYAEVAGRSVTLLQRRARDGEKIDAKEIAKVRHIATLAQQRAPENPDVLSTLGATYTFAGEDPKLGIKWSAAAYSLAPSRVDIAADLVLLYARAGKPELAKAMFDRAITPSGSQFFLDQARENLALADYYAASEPRPAGATMDTKQLLDRARKATKNTKLRAAIDAAEGGVSVKP